ncbi:hypothetical protein BJQ96_00918 [Flavobacterium sp. PL0002]|nr:hypothetical protein [Flavobacterium sp. PL002]
MYQFDKIKIMKNRYLYSIFFCVLLQTSTAAQNKTNHFSELIRDVTGDLNNDGFPDSVIVMMDIINETRPLRLQLFLSQPDGKRKLIVTSDQIIEAMYPLEKNGAYNGYQIPDFFIENGILTMWSEIEKGNINYEFKYQRGNFELIKLHKITHNSTIVIDENTVFTETNFNLITGLRTEVDQLLGSDKIVNKRTKTVLIRPLPKIQDFKFTDKYLY